MDAMIPVDIPETDDPALTESFCLRTLRTDSITKATLVNENEIQSADVIEPVVKTTHTTPGGFDVQRVYEAFVAALKESNNPQSPIGTQDYINGYRELMK
jgi:hypothetical protein